MKPVAGADGASVAPSAFNNARGNKRFRGGLTKAGSEQGRCGPPTAARSVRRQRKRAFPQGGRSHGSTRSAEAHHGTGGAAVGSKAATTGARLEGSACRQAQRDGQGRSGCS